MNCKWCGREARFLPGPLVRPDWPRSQCKGCGALAFQDVPSAENLAEFYASAWQEERLSDGFATGATDIAISRALLSVSGWQPGTASKCLDYGAGRGEFAAALISQGCDQVYVFEPFGKPRDIGVAKWVANLDDLEGEHFDWIFLIEVIEHMRDPVSELKNVRRLMRPGGRLFITTPNARGLRARVEGYRWREAQNPTHVNLFTAAALKDCLRKAGFSKTIRSYKPVRFNATGIRSIALSIAQRLGVDGGLRYLVTTGNDG